MKKSFNIQELLHHKSKPHETKPMHSSSLSSASSAFQRHQRSSQEHNLKHPSLVDLITTKQNKTKQNKLPSFTDRCDLCDKHNPFSHSQFTFESCSQSSTHNIKTNNDNTKSGASRWLLFSPWKKA